MVRFIFQLLKFILRLISVLYRQVLGHYTFTDISTNCPAVTMTITAIDGMTTTIHCKERRYLRNYKKWYIKNSIISTYHVYSTVHGEVSDNYSKICSAIHSFPKLCASWRSDRSQREAAIEAYIDILLNSLHTSK